MWSDVSDFDFPGLRVETKVDTATVSVAGMPLEHLRCPLTRPKSTCGPEFGVLHPLGTFRRHSRSPARCRPSHRLPLLRRAIEFHQLPDDGVEQMRRVPEAVLDARSEQKVRKNSLAVLPKSSGVTARQQSTPMPRANRSGMLGTGELIDLFGCRPDCFVRQQLVEVDRHSVAVPFRGRRKPDGDSIGDGTEHQRFAITRRQRPLLARQKPILDGRPDLRQERLFVRQPHQQPELFPKSPAP